MQIPNEAIEKLKREVDLVELIRRHGVQLKRRGRSYVGLCPFHKEDKPSFTVNPSTNLYHCFGCPKGENGGNAITFLMKKQSLGFREAYAALVGGSAPTRPAPAVATVSTPSEDSRGRIRRQKLLGRVVAYYRRSFIEKPAGREYLARRGITDPAALDAYNAGLCDGTLLSIAPHDAAVLADLKAIGILSDKDREHFESCVVFPLIDENHTVVGMYGRRLTDGQVNHLYLPGPRRGLVNRAGANGRVVLCEAVIDALTLSCHGINALPCFGVQGFTAEHLAVLNRPAVEEVLVCFDGDEAGRTGSGDVSGQLRAAGIKTRLVDLPDGDDINSLVVRDGIERMRALVGAAAPTSAPAVTEMFEATPHGFVLRKASRTYEVKGISRQGTQLRVTLKASRPDGLFELATIDLYSHRSRLWFAGLCAKLLAISEDEAKSDVNDVLGRLESQQSETTEVGAVELSDTERGEAQEVLAAPDLIDRIAEDLETVGYTGERTNKLLCYLTAVSRKLDEPLSVLIQSRSAAGKSALQDAILSLVPDEDALHYSRVTDQALFYQNEDALAHKLLAIEEADGMGGAAYSIRAMQSAKKLTVAATAKDPTTGKMRTEQYTVKGPLAVMLTTTRTDFDQETMSRFLVVTVDESSEMTAKIHEKQRDQDTLAGLLRQKAGEQIAKLHHNAQRLLTAVHVVNPYAPQLTFPTKSLRSRRDHKKYLGLIKAIAFLRQKQRPVKEVMHGGEPLRYIEATLEDIALANSLGRDVLGQSGSDITPQARQLLTLIRKMLSNGHSDCVGKDGVATFTRRILREYTGWSDWQVRTHLAELVDLELVHARQGAFGKEYLYVLGDEADSIWTQPTFAPTDVEGVRQAFLSVAAQP
jgi:DNA primase